MTTGPVTPVAANLIYPPAAVREIDRIAITEQGIAGYELMCRAAQASLEVIQQTWPQAQRWLIVCGSGNNAGDGYVLARLAAAAGRTVRVQALSDPGSLQGDAARAYADFVQAGGEALPWSGELLAADSDLLVDALLGTGLQRPLEGAWRDCVQAINAQNMPVAALDVPTGLNSLSGAVMGAAVEAALTITFVAFKQGLFLAAGPDCCGRVVMADLDIAPVATSRVAPVLRQAGPALLAKFTAPRLRGTHKGQLGHVLVIGGNRGTGGAVRLAGEAALRAGAGLVTVATRPENVATVLAGRPELMCRGVDTASELDDLLQQVAQVAIGPGLGTDTWAQSLWDRVGSSDRPLVVDADALNLLALQPWHRGNWVLTPHPGEAGRLLGTSAAAVQADRPAAVHRLVERFHGTVVLKGAGTLIAGAPGKPDTSGTVDAAHASAALPWLVAAGNPGMATAGMGDVLTGLCAGLLAQHPRAASADVAAAAALAHALAGDRAARNGERGLLAGDLLEELRACLND